MKRLVICLLMIIMIIGIFGCSSSGGEDKSVLESLKDEKIVDKDLKLIDEVTYIGTVLFRTEYTYSIYENDDSELVAIFYKKSSSSDDDYDYLVRIYSDVTTNKVEYIDDVSSLDTYYKYKDGKTSETNKYDMSDVKEYYAYKKGSKSGVKYEFEEVKEN